MSPDKTRAQADDLFEALRTRILQHLSNTGVLDGHALSALPLDAIAVELPRDPAHGELATNAAMVLAKPLRRNPREIAAALSLALAEDDMIDTAEVAGPGFINLRLNIDTWHKALSSILAAGDRFGRNVVGEPSELPKTNVEYVSANPTGPMHVGHCRGAVVGDAVANIFEFAGYPVTREYYINDAGGQVDVLGRSAFLRYCEALGEDIGEIPSGYYPGEYLNPVGEQLVERYGSALAQKPESDWLPIVRRFAIDAMMGTIKQDLSALHVEHDEFFSEASLQSGSENDRVAQAISALEGRDLVYMGRLEKPKGESAEDWEDREQLLFRSTKFGDDVDRALKKSDGSYTYFASDIAYHFDKFQRGFTNQINIFGADHGGYVKRMKAAVEAMSDGEAQLEIRLCQLVKLFRDGEPVTMSKRSGSFVTLREVVDEVGTDAVRFMMLYRKNDAPLDFDFKAVTEQSKDNPVFYVQYAHARCMSVSRLAADALGPDDIPPDGFSDIDFSQLTDDGEIELIRAMAQWPKIVRTCVKTYEPHRMAHYLYGLASLFHSHWNRGKAEEHLRFINHDNRSLTIARLALVGALAQTLRQGLMLLGVQAPEEMR